MAAKVAVHLIAIAAVVFSFAAGSSPGAGHWRNVKILDSVEATSYYNKCFEAKLDWRWLRLWSRLNVKVKDFGFGPTQGKITVVCGANETDVEKQLVQSNSLLPSLLPPWAWLHYNNRMSPLTDNCIGVRAAEVVHITVTETFISELYFLLTLVGVILFLAAPRLSKSVVFHYSTGITVGVLGSFLILVYILSRFIPRKSGALSLLLGGWALCLYFLHWVIDNFVSMQYKTYLIGYFVLAAAISFTVCYWYGPVTNDRTIYLIQLFLQLLGWRSGPVMIKLLTEDEYYEQGRVETKKALDKLREYCRSPECNQWKMIANLESPKRFAQFIMGEEDHVSRNELSAYEEDLSLLTLDSSVSGSEGMTSDSEMETD